MINLMRMDLKRMQKSKSTYVIMIVTVLLLVIQFLAVYVALNPDVQAWLSAHGVIFQMSGMDQLKDLSLLEFFHLSLTQNFFLIVIGILVALFNCHERETGFIKNVLSIHVHKTQYVLSKIIIQSLYVLILLVVCFIEFLLLNMLMGSYFLVNELSECLIYLGLLWIVGIGVISMFTALTVWIRSQSGCVAIAIVYATGLWVMLITSIFGLFGMSDLLNYTLLYQVNGMLEVLSTLDVSSLFQLLLNVGIFLVVYISLSVYGLKKKDI